jgi:hypothetical protein
MIEDCVTRSILGIGGTFATVELAQVNLVVSILVGIATLTFMVVSIIKILKEL